MQDIFLPTSSKTTRNVLVETRKVLVEGEPGIGKTTLATKLASDWAHGTLDSGFGQFSLVFLLKAKDLAEGDSLEDLLLKHLLPEDFDSKNFMDCLKECPQKILFIIDGLDEVQQENALILKLIQGRILSKSHVLVTARPGFLSSHTKFFDSLLLNIGYSAEQQIEFATKFMTDIAGESSMGSCVDFVSKLENDELMKDLCRNPLHLSILCMLQIEYGKDVPKSRTALFQQMHSFIMKRASSKLGLTDEEFVEKCRPLYKIAYRGLVEGRHKVSLEEVKAHIDVQTVEHSCFISKEIQVSYFCPTQYYSFNHKSFQEYFAAVYIASKDREERLEMLRQIRHRSPYYMVTSFLCGLLQADTMALKDVLDAVNNDIYLPKASGSAMGIQYILDNHNSHLILRCLSELSEITDLRGVISDKLEIGQVCFSLLWCTESCVHGMVTYLRAVDSTCSCDGQNCHRAVKITMQMQCLDQRTGLFQKLLHAVCSSRHAGCLHVHHFASTAQLSLLFSELKNAPAGCLHTLNLHGMNVPDTELSEEEKKTFSWVLFHLKTLKLKEFSSGVLLTQLLSWIMPCNQLEGLQISCSTFSEATCHQLCATLEKMDKLTCFRFRKNLVDTEPEFYVNMLDIISGRKYLSELALTHLPTKRMFERRVSIVPTPMQNSTVHVFPALSSCLQSSHLTTLSVCSTVMGEPMLNILCSAVKANQHLQCVEFKENSVSAFRALDDVLSSLIDLPGLQSLSLRRTDLDETNYKVVVDLISKSPSLKYLCTPAWLGSLDHLAAGLHRNHSLEVLELRNLQFHDQKVCTFAEAVRNHGQLRQLRVGCNCAAPVDMHELIQACTLNQSLSKVMFVNFGLDSNHVKCLGEMLEGNHSISSLNLSGSSLKLEDLTVLNESLTRRPKLKSLNVSRSKVHNWDPIVDQLKENVVMLKTELF